MAFLFKSDPSSYVERVTPEIRADLLRVYDDTRTRLQRSATTGPLADRLFRLLGYCVDRDCDCRNPGPRLPDDNPPRIPYGTIHFPTLTGSRLAWTSTGGIVDKPEVAREFLAEADEVLNSILALPSAGRWTVDFAKEARALVRAVGDDLLRPTAEPWDSDEPEVSRAVAMLPTKRERLEDLLSQLWHELREVGAVGRRIPDSQRGRQLDGAAVTRTLERAEKLRLDLGLKDSLWPVVAGILFVHRPDEVNGRKWPAFYQGIQAADRQRRRLTAGPTSPT